MFLHSGVPRKRFRAPLVALLALCLPQHASAEENASNVHCRIRAAESSDLIRLDAVAVSPVSTTGTYRLRVMKRNTSGSSQNLQSGRFALTAGREEILTTVILDASAHNAYAARLDLEWDKETLTCTAP
ncbi:curli-like amyloid fiber formation chaperone CsgH [Microvirga sp. Mcv34]|uniref:curli-like amyloid fiber formation chaperone CsgH n=1 Tax=Microvirga sp. Mcv34 TaxID=2926016 RepID=UPI0021C607DE|nr:curli-like amyloid fiber formation chaperone CsgH [Microvirga sp. Mcv34]